MPSVFLQPWGPLLVVIHALSSIVLCGASVHQALLAVQLVRRQPVRPSLLRTYALTTLGAYLSVMISGALLYPRYRVVIRALFLDRQSVRRSFVCRTSSRGCCVPLCEVPDGRLSSQRAAFRGL